MHIVFTYCTLTSESPKKVACPDSFGGQFKSFVVVQVNNNNGNCYCCGWGRFLLETYRFSMGHVKWCVSLFSAFSCENLPKKAVLWSSSSNLRHQVFRGGGSSGASPSFVNPWVFHRVLMSVLISTFRCIHAFRMAFSKLYNMSTKLNIP